ncbi:hypothetical protein [Catellatospora sp. NPDC049609]|uniref:hypothetical protein n=1 Tax=Catellatospora sp. NPDC049609 TaxID=3155505 RepID=UPI0034408D01
MPTVKLTVGDVTVELTANECAVDDLADQALVLYRDAVASPRPPRAPIGFAQDDDRKARP